MRCCLINDPDSPKGEHEDEREENIRVFTFGLFVVEGFRIPT